MNVYVRIAATIVMLLRDFGPYWMIFVTAVNSGLMKGKKDSPTIERKTDNPKYFVRCIHRNSHITLLFYVTDV
jgi:hypothetical protein